MCACERVRVFKRQKENEHVSMCVCVFERERENEYVCVRTHVHVCMKDGGGVENKQPCETTLLSE